MSVFKAEEFDDHEEVAFFWDPTVQLHAIIAIHNTTLGPGLGGVRMWPYENENAAVRDVLRLSKGMTYKAAILDVRLGGGKSVIIGDPRHAKTPALMQAMGRLIERMGNRYIAGEDIGTNPDDMREIRTQTSCVTCLRKRDGGYGDPARFTALGVLSALRAGIETKFSTSDFTGIRVAVQGMGNVGQRLCKLLAEAGAKLVIADAHMPKATEAAHNFGAALVAPEEIYAAEVEAFAPCAVGAILNQETIPQLQAQVVAGAANNQLDKQEHGKMMAERGIVYLPDYVANGGGLICCAAEWYREDSTDIVKKVVGIHDTCIEILQDAEEKGITPEIAANQIARRRFAPGCVEANAAQQGI